MLNFRHVYTTSTASALIWGYVSENPMCVVQPYANLATVINNASLEYEVGGASNLAQLRKLKSQLDPTNLFQRTGFVGL